MNEIDDKQNFKFALIGHPLGHSLSEIVHMEAFKTTGLKGSYCLLDTEPENLIQQIKYLKTNDFQGFNVTIPFKIPVGAFLDEYDETCEFTKCVNTVKIDNNKSLKGYNTDVFGFFESIRIRKINLNKTNVSILGLGGAARAIIAALKQLGVDKIDIFVRNIIDHTSTVKK